MERLRAAAGEGRLDGEELERRIGTAYAARTDAELASLTADLPALPAPAPAAAPVRRDERIRERLAGFIVVNATCIAIWAISGAGGFWPVWVLFGTGLGLFGTLVRRGLGVEPRERDRNRNR